MENGDTGMRCPGKERQRHTSIDVSAETLKPKIKQALIYREGEATICDGNYDMATMIGHLVATELTESTDSYSQVHNESSSNDPARVSKSGLYLPMLPKGIFQSLVTHDQNVSPNCSSIKG